jgi:hypothetical protein
VVELLKVPPQLRLLCENQPCAIHSTKPSHVGDLVCVVCRVCRVCRVCVSCVRVLCASCWAGALAQLRLCQVQRVSVLSRTRTFRCGSSCNLGSSWCCG